MRTCEEDVELNKCEGSCVSSTMPSAMERSGFTKVRTRTVQCGQDECTENTPTPLTMEIVLAGLFLL